MSVLDDYERVSRSRPCPVCGKPDWCLVSRDDPANPSRAICQRIDSRRRWGEAGCLHIMRDTACEPTHRRSIPLTRLPRCSDLAKLADHYCRLATDRYVQHVGNQLGLTSHNLRRLRIGRTPRDESSFPMCGWDGNTIGICLRRRNGRKLAVRGSRNGLFIPDGLPERFSNDAPLLIAEGASDTAALLDLDFHVVGRPSCTGGTLLLREFVHRRSVAAVVMVADRDVPGCKGATHLAQNLRPLCRSVKIIMPPNGTNDARAWKGGGATHADIVRVIEQAPSLGLKLSVGRGSVR